MRSSKNICNIYIFNDNPDENLVIPRFKNGYYKFKNTRPTIFLYENIETKTNHKIYDRLVILNDDDIDMGSLTNEIVPGLNQFVSKMFHSYISTSTLGFPVSSQILLNFELIGLHENIYELNCIS